MRCEDNGMASDATGNWDGWRIVIVVTVMSTTPVGEDS